MSHSNSTFKRNQLVEALWPEDNKWYPARVLKVKPNDVFRIQFDGWVEQYDFQAHQMRESVQDGARVRGGNQRSSAKEAAPQPAPAPVSKPSAREPQAHAKDVAPASASENIRVRVCGRGGGHASPATLNPTTPIFTMPSEPNPVVCPKEAAPQPSLAPAPIPSSGPEADAQRLFDGFSRDAERPSRAADHYAALKVAPDCSEEDIRRVQKRKSFDWHTDRTSRHAEELVPLVTERRPEVVALVARMLKPIHEEEIRFLNTVKDVLTDTQERSKYDDSLRPQNAISPELEDFITQIIETGATGTFKRTFTTGGAQTFQQVDRAGRVIGASGGSTAQQSDRRKKPRNSNAKDRAFDAHGQMQRGQSQAAATAADLQDQVQRLKTELSSSHATAASSRSEAECARAQMQLQQSQAAATIADLQDQVQRLTAELSSSHAAALEQLQVSFSAILENQKQCRKSAAAQHLQHHAHAAAATQDDNRSMDDAAYGPVSQKLQDSRTVEEQLRRTLEVQHCGS